MMNRLPLRGPGAGRQRGSSTAFPGLLLLALMLFGLSACNQVRFFYDRADWLVERWVDGKLDVTGRQLAQWRPVLAAGLDRHRRDELPVLVAFLGRAEQAVAGGLGRGETACLFDMADSLYRRHARLAVEIAVPLLMEVTAEQLDHLRESLADDAEEYREKYLAADLEERAAERTERFTRRIERWSGRLDDAQRALVTARIGAMPDVASAWLDYRLARETALLAMLRNRTDAHELRRFLTESWVELRGRSPMLEAGMDAVREQTIDLLLALDSELSVAQRERLLARLSDLRRDLAEAMTGDAAVRTASAPGDACAGAG